MSIVSSFDPSPAILEPGALGKTIPDFPEIVVSAFEQRNIDVAVERYAPQTIGKLKFGVEIPIYRLDYSGVPIALYMSPIGGPSTAWLMEEAIVMGGRRFVFFGSCGTLDAAVPEGGLVIPDAAYRDEGTSYHYAPAGDYIEIPTANRLAEIFDELRLPYTRGRTWTTDAIYRETRGNMHERRGEGCITVEMECASVMAVARFRGVDAYQFLYTGDNLDADAWEPRSLNTLPANNREKYLRIALETASRL